MAREQLNVVVVICANRSYQILATELERAGMAPEGAAKSLVQLTDPTVDFCGLATGFGVASEAVDDAAGLRMAIARSLAEPGPHLIEARMAS